MNKFLHFINIFVIVCFALFAKYAYAITVNEGSDFPNVSFPPLELGPLDIGSNIISGSINGSVADVYWGEASGGNLVAGHTYSGDNLDRFTYTVPTDLLVTDLSITISNYSGNAPYTLGSARGFGGPTSPYTNVSFSNNGTLDYSGLLIPGQLSPGDYIFQFAFQCSWYTPTLSTCEIGDSVSFDWQLNITTISTAPVSEVPLPAPVWLLGSGLLGLVGIARRKKNS